MNIGDLVARVHERLLDTLEADVGGLVLELAPLTSASMRRAVVRRVEARRVGLGPLDVLFADPEISELMINGPGPVWVERSGTIARSPVSLDAGEIDLLVERLIAPTGRRVDHRSPCVDGRLADGSRIHVVIPPVAIDGPYVTIRRYVLRSVGLAAFAAPDAVDIVRAAVRDRRSILVSGGTGSGKTTLLNALAGEIDGDERLVTVEDAAELRLLHPHVVRLETRPASAEGVGLLTMRDLVRNALRMRPDRLIIGEVRGAEAFDLMHALNTGHRGCLSTVHANSPVDALRRLEGLAVLGGEGVPLAAIRAQLRAALETIVHVERRPDGRRAVGVIAEVVDGRVEERWRDS